MGTARSKRLARGVVRNYVDGRLGGAVGRNGRWMNINGAGVGIACVGVVENNLIGLGDLVAVDTAGNDRAAGRGGRHRGRIGAVAMVAGGINRAERGVNVNICAYV